MATLEDAPSDRAERDPAMPGSLPARSLTLLIIAGPVAALLIGIPLLWGRPIALHDIVLAAGFYAVSAVGVTVGFHRLFTHRSFRANRPLKIVLAAAGSTAVQGSLISWVAVHRRHHRFADQPGDPHSARPHGPGVRSQLRALGYAHLGWLFKVNPTYEERYASDLLQDRDLRIVSDLFPVFAIGSLVLPFAIGWGLTGTLRGALAAALWAGLVRMMLLHHVTWSVNSICHAFGTRLIMRNDLSTNVAPLALLSLGESWHNFHHAHPSCARHGALPHQVDTSAALIRVFERAGWATNVRWPTDAQVASATCGSRDLRSAKGRRPAAKRASSARPNGVYGVGGRSELASASVES